MPEPCPPVSAVCLTYGRAALLEEATEAFLRQDYGGVKELVILNDLADQTLRFDHPEVRVVNLPRRFRTLGEKLNAAVALCSHDLLFLWDDDDVCLPHRVSFSVERFNPEKGYFGVDRAWQWEEGAITCLAEAPFHAAGCWSRALFDRAGGYPAVGSGADQGIERRFEAMRPGATARHPIHPEEVFYLYRLQGTNSYHLSAAGTYVASPDRQRELIGEAVARGISSGEIPRGEITLRPRWHDDYVRLVRDHLAGLAGPSGGAVGDAAGARRTGRPEAP